MVCTWQPYVICEVWFPWIYQPNGTQSHYVYESGILRGTRMHNRRAKKKLTLARDESGAVAILIAGIFAFLCGFMGLAVDIGHVYRAKAELQRTADAGALAGVTGLVPYTGSVPQTPWWGNGEATALRTIQLKTNIADYHDDDDKSKFTDQEVTVGSGYWLLKSPTPCVQPPITGLPKARPTNDTWLPEPAITVTLSKNVTMYLAPLVGFPGPLKVEVTAIAILPEVYGVTGVPPIAVSVDAVYDESKVVFVVDASTQDIKIQSNKGIAGWINLDTTAHDNSVPSVNIAAPLIAGGIGSQTGDQIHLVPGTKAVLTDYIKTGSSILLPVIADGFKQGDVAPIFTWAEFDVQSVDANSMTGHFKNIGYLPGQKPDERPSGLPATPMVWGTPKLVSP